MNFQHLAPKHLALYCAAIFLFSVAVRVLTWEDLSRDAWKVQTSVVQSYRDSARHLALGDFKGFVDDINHFGHPPGYPILLAALYRVAGEWTTTVRVVQIVSDAIAVVVLFLIGLELVPLGAAVTAALLAAVSPQFAYFTVLLLPDSLVVLPILLAVYCLIRAQRNPRLLNFVLAGAFIGLSCWFRANALLLPFFVAAAAAILVKRGKRWRAATAVIAGAVLLIAPITIKNAIVYRHFVPLSLGAGQTLLEGIADYDAKGISNIPKTDLGIMRQEAEWFGGKPEYAQLLFGRDGIERDRKRVARGLSVIRSHPFWFAGVMVRRGTASTRLDPVPVLAPESPVSHDITRVPIDSTWWSNSRVHISQEQTKYGTLWSSENINIKSGYDYVLYGYFKLERGRIGIKITDASGSDTLAANTIEMREGQDVAYDQLVAVPFVSGTDTDVRVVIANNASDYSNLRPGPIWINELGPSSGQWLRYVRIPIGWVQFLFKTAFMLPLAIIGLVILMRRREWRTLVIVLTVPAYYLIVQSAVHTERRYVYVIHYFFLLLAATTLWKGIDRINKMSSGWTR